MSYADAIEGVRRLRRDAPAAGYAEFSRTVPALLGAGLALVLLLLDFGTWIELNIALAYSLPLVFAAASRKPWLLWTLAFVLIVATFVVYQVQIPHARVAPPGPAGWPGMQDPYLVDRSLAAATLLLTAAILQGWLFSLRAIELRDHAIEQNNLRLARANQELTRHKEEIVRQNRELEQRRREAEATSLRKTQMLAGISHDIRTPIHAIALMAEVIRRTAHDPAQEQRLPVFAQRLQAHALAVGELLAEVMDLAALDSGTSAVHVSAFQLDAVLAEQRQRMAPVAEARQLTLEVAPSSVPVTLRTDKVKLERVIGNLVSNAIKFTTVGGVTLGSRFDAAGRVCIDVKDSGCGIKPEDLPRIFGEYCQVDPSAVQSASGWGLGLAICRRLVGLLGGELLVASEYGQGSTFTVMLPASAIGKPDVG